jgi:Fe-S cluster assembly ATPase SufC
MFQKLGFYYQFRYSREKYKKMFYYLCYPRIIKSGDKSLALELEEKGYDWLIAGVE